MGSFVCLKGQQRQQVSHEDAINAALTKLTGSNVRSGHNALQISEKCDSAGNILMYEVTLDSVSLLLSGSKACYPILAQTQVFSGPLFNRYDSIPKGLQIFINEYLSQIELCFSIDTISLYHESMWDSLIRGINLEPRSRTSIGPLIRSRWDQKGCNNNISIVGYEYHTPAIQNGCDHALAGCVAVAMGQVMNYWKYPVSLDWNKRFDWCNMSNVLESTSPTFAQNREAISSLLRNCGDGVNMTYGCDGSGALFENIRNVLVNVYNYSDDAEYVAKNNMSNEEWASILIQQIDLGRPVLYEADDGTGLHVFICDGYADNNWFSFNWGAGNESYGSYYIGELTPYFHNQQHNYSFGHRILMNIYPSNQIDLCNRDVLLSNYYEDNTVPLNSHQPWEILPVVVTNLTSASEESPSYWRTIPSGASAIYQAQRSVSLKNGFTVERGAIFLARLEPCACCESQNRNLNTDDVSLTDFFEMAGNNMPLLSPMNTTSDLPELATQDISLNGSTSLYPNPTSKEITMETNGEVTSVVIYNTLGQPVGGWQMRQLTSLRMTLDVSSLPPGTYILTVKKSDGSTLHRRFSKR